MSGEPKDELKREAAKLIGNDLQLTPPADLSDLREWLANGLRELINRDREKLYWFLYRIDVSEQKAKAMLAAGAPAEAPYILADLVLERQLQKAETRRAYRKGRLPGSESGWKE